MAMRARIRRVFKWTGLAICGLTLLGWWAWTFSPEGWVPRPHYAGGRWGFVVGRAYLRLCYVSIVPPPGTKLRNLTLTEQATVAAVISSPCVDNVLPDYGAWFHAGWLPTRRTNRIGFSGNFDMRHYDLYFPLSTFPLLILIPVGILTALLWFLDRRRSQPGRCEDCGYDLTGNVSGRCPECGAEVPPPGDAVQPEMPA
jgi:hypothetical protein